MSENKAVKHLKMTEKTKLISQQWNVLSKEIKDHYENLAKKDVERYNTELETLKSKGFFINKNGESSLDLYKPKYIDDVILPKRTLSPFFCFLIEKSKELRSNNPDLKIGEVSKKVGE